MATARKKPALSDPFPPATVHWRVGSTTKDKTKGMALAYIDARHVMDRLDEVIGHAGWSDSYSELAGRIICTLTIDGVSKSDGAGDTATEPEKGGLSDAFKRAAVKWGIGRYLYGIKSPWVAINPRGRSFVIAPHEHARLEKLLPGSVVYDDDPPCQPAVPDMPEQRRREIESQTPPPRTGDQRPWSTDRTLPPVRGNWTAWVDDVVALMALCPSLDERDEWMGANSGHLHNLKAADAHQARRLGQAMKEITA